MVGFGETYVAAFALVVGATPFEVGLLTTLPLLVGGGFQLLVPSLTAYIGNKRWVVGSAVVQAATFVPIAALATAHGSLFVPLLLLVCVYWMAGLGINPAWNAWMGEMIPARLRSRYFGRRNVPVQAMVLASLVAAGFALHVAEQSPAQLATGFMGIFAMASALRLVSAYFLIKQHEPPVPYIRKGPSLKEVVRGFRSLPYGHLIPLVVLSNGAVHIAAPYFTPLMLGELQLSYAEFTVLNGTVLVARLLSSPYWGEIARNYGNRRILQVSALLIAPLPALWAVSDHFAYLFVLQLIAGFAWSGFDLAVVLSFFDCTDQENRARVLSLFNFLNGIALVGGSLFGGALLRIFGTKGYLYVLIGSSVMRGLVVVFLSRNAGIRRPGEHSFQDVLVRVISFRPGQGAMSRPIIMRDPRDENAK